MKSVPSKLGLLSVVLLGINGMIGPGIFLLPGKVMALAGPASLLIYLVATIAALAIAYCFAECASMFSGNGSAYLYSKEAFGPLIAFQVGMMKWVAGIVAWAALAVAFATSLEPLWPTTAEEPLRSALLIVILSSLSLLNIFGLKVLKLCNNAITIGKIVPLLLFILFGAFYMQGSHFFPFFPERAGLDAFGSGTLLIFFTFGGFETLAVAADEIENPRRNIPLALFLILIFTALLYFLLQVVSIGVAGPSLAESTLPLVAAAEKLAGGVGKWLAVAFTLLACGGTALAASYYAPRSGYAIAQDGLFPARLAELGQFGTPVGAIVVTTFLAIAVALSGSFVKLAAISVVTRAAQYFPTCLALLLLRKRNLERKGIFLTALGPITSIFGMAFTLLVVFNASYDELTFGLIGLLLAIPLFFFLRAGLSPPSARGPLPLDL